MGPSLGGLEREGWLRSSMKGDFGLHRLKVRMCGLLVRDRRTREQLDELLDQYTALPTRRGETARRIRQSFLDVLPSFSAAERVSRAALAFLAEEIQPGDFETRHLHSPARVSVYCELLHSFQFPDERHAQRIRTLMTHILSEAVLEYEHEHHFAKVFTLLRLVPASAFRESEELSRLHSRAYFFERRRVMFHRRLLFIYLIAQAMFVLFVFPLLFIYVENRPAPHTLRYADGLYWAAITAATVGYGDIIPQTGAGRAMAGVLGLTGFITIGVIAGLILKWITPQRFGR